VPPRAPPRGDRCGVAGPDVPATFCAFAPTTLSGSTKARSMSTQTEPSSMRLPAPALGSLQLTPGPRGEVAPALQARPDAPAAHSWLNRDGDIRPLEVALDAAAYRAEVWALRSMRVGSSVATAADPMAAPVGKAGRLGGAEDPRERSYIRALRPVLSRCYRPGLRENPCASSAERGYSRDAGPWGFQSPVGAVVLSVPLATLFSEVLSKFFC
jgi:hypothetical protein